MSYKKRVFLGGTVGKSKWREALIPFLTIDYFNPVVEDWNEEAAKEELKQREECDYCLYLLTPATPSTYSIAEVVDDSNKRPNKTVFIYIDEDVESKFDKHQVKAMDKIGQMVESNGAYWARGLSDLVKYLNK